MTRDDYVDLIKAAFKDLGYRVVMKRLVAEVPFFGWGLVNPIIGHLVSYILEYLISSAEMFFFFKYTDLRVSRQGKEFLEAALRHQEAKTKSKEERERAEKDFINAARVFIDLRS